MSTKRYTPNAVAKRQSRSVANRATDALAPAKTPYQSEAIELQRDLALVRAGSLSRSGKNIKVAK
jgi:hypothetical protein